MPIVHWLGAGLSSVPGIRRLAKNGNQMILWNRTLQKAEQALADVGSSAQARELDWERLSEEVSQGDVVVSMLPANMHLQVADICLQRNSHFVSSSYVSESMQALSDRAAKQGLSFVNEVGLDPGIDHLMAHILVDAYQQSDDFDPQNEHYFRSYCGGFPKHANDFKYKFSWSPLGVLRALKSPAKWIDDGATKTTEKPWTSLQQYATRLPNGTETFQAYPNRNSLPFLKAYQFGDDWNIREFVRGTLRLDGWSHAWQDIFDLVENSDGDAGQKLLADKSQQLWQDYRYETNEPDRVVLSVELQAKQQGQTVWHQVYCLDESGNEDGSAMARLVSLTTSIAVDSVLNGEIRPGVSPAPHDIELVNRWLDSLSQLGESFSRIDLA